MGCGASTGSSRDAWPAVGEPACQGHGLRIRKPMQRTAKVHDLDVTAILPDKTLVTSQGQKTTTADDLAAMEPDECEETAEARYDVEEFEIEAQPWSSMKSADVKATRNNPFPSPPDRRLHEQHLKRMDRLRNDLTMDPDLFEILVRNRRSIEGLTTGISIPSQGIQADAPDDEFLKYTSP
mmetsp:Transcript_66734/g.156432  ORF Transcript_66734/g.156432 Transcript_66734/m.156432 type:complete len:181 (-) Transcript_66734:90-632(-)